MVPTGRSGVPAKMQNYPPFAPTRLEQEMHMTYQSKRSAAAIGRVPELVSGALRNPRPDNGRTPAKPRVHSAVQVAKRVNPQAVHRAPLDAHVTVCFSTYPELLVGMDAIVDRCREAGNPKASRSWLIREAMAMLDVERLVRGQSRRQR